MQHRVEATKTTPDPERCAEVRASPTQRRHGDVTARHATTSRALRGELPRQRSPSALLPLAFPSPHRASPAQVPKPREARARRGEERQRNRGGRGARPRPQSARKACLVSTGGAPWAGVRGLRRRLCAGRPSVRPLAGQGAKLAPRAEAASNSKAKRGAPWRDNSGHRYCPAIFSQEYA